MKIRSLLVALAGVLAFGQSERPLQLTDIVAWKRIQMPAVSNNGQWFAYRLAPAEGDAEVVVYNLETGKEQRFPIGDPSATAPPPTATPARPPAGEGPGGSAALALSADSKWVAFQVYPTERDAKRLKKDRKPIQTKAVLVELSTGKKTEFEKVRRFAFSGEKSAAIALQRYGPEPAPGGPGTGAAAGGSGATPPERPSGSDLLLYDLSTGAEINFGNVSEFAFDKPGDRLAWLVDAQDKAGNGVELRNMESGAVQSLDHAQAVYKGLSWTEKGDGLAVLRGVEDKAFEDKLYTLVAFKDFDASGPAPVRSVFDPRQDSGFPKGMSISPNRNPAWNEELSAVTFGIHEVKPKKGKDAASGDGEAKEARRRQAEVGAVARPRRSKGTSPTW